MEVSRKALVAEDGFDQATHSGHKTVDVRPNFGMDNVRRKSILFLHIELFVGARNRRLLGERALKISCEMSLTLG